MEKVRRQFGEICIDGSLRSYCNISVEVCNDEEISKDALCGQFKLLAESFWIYMETRKELKEKKIREFHELEGTDGLFSRRESW